MNAYVLAGLICGTFFLGLLSLAIVMYIQIYNLLHPTP